MVDYKIVYKLTLPRVVSALRWAPNCKVVKPISATCIKRKEEMGVNKSFSKYLFWGCFPILKLPPTLECSVHITVQSTSARKHCLLYTVSFERVP